MVEKRKILFSAVILLNVLALGALLVSPTRYEVDFSSVLEIWGDVFSDADRVGLTITAIPIKREIEIGNQATQHFPLVRDHPRQLYLDAVGSRVAEGVSRRGIPYRFHVVDTNRPNAYALPGGHVLVTAGMLDLVESEAELAAVLAHEIAHVDLKHCIESLQYQLLVEFAAGKALGGIAAIAYRLVSLGFSELKEREADRTAIILVANAGYSPFEAIRIWRRLELTAGEVRGESKPPRGPESEIGQAIIEALNDYFATHPSFESRIRDIESLFDRNMDTWEGFQFYVGRANYAEIKPRSADNRESERVTFSRQSAQFLILRGEAAGLAGDAARAAVLLTEAIDAGGDEPEVHWLRAQAYAALDNKEAAEADAKYVVGKISKRIEEAKTRIQELEKVGDKQGTLEALKNVIPIHERLLDVLSFWFNLPAQDVSEVELLVYHARVAKNMVHMRIGGIYREIGQTQNAVGEFRIILKTNPLHFAAIEGLALAKIDLDQEKEVLVWLGELVRKHPREVELLRIRAQVYRAAGNEKKAEREQGRYERFRDHDTPPLDDDDWDSLTKFWDRSKFGDFKAFSVTEKDQKYWYQTWGYKWARTASANSVRKCSKAKDRPCRLYALGTKIVWNLNNEELEAAYDEYEDRVHHNVIEKIENYSNRINLGESYLFFMRGDEFLKLGQYEKAIGDFTSYLHEFPGSSSAYYKRGLAHYRSWRFDLALADLQSSQDFSAITQGYSRLALGDVDGALLDFDRWIDRNASKPYRGLLGRAAVHIAKGDFVTAQSDIERIINDNPESAHWANEVCWILARLALPAAGKLYCSKANDLQLLDARYLDSLAFIHWQLGEVPAAIKLLEDVKHVNRKAPDPEVRLNEFRTMLATTFLILKDYNPGMVRKHLNDKARDAIESYQADHGLPVTGEITDELLGHLTPLGFGSFRIEEIPGKLSREQIKKTCSDALYGKPVFITVGPGFPLPSERYLCNTDGITVRKEN